MRLFRRHRWFSTLALGATAAGIVVWLSWGRVRAAGESYYSQLELFSYVVNLIKNYYVDEVDPKKLMSGAISVCATQSLISVARAPSGPTHHTDCSRDRARDRAPSATKLHA